MIAEKVIIRQISDKNAELTGLAKYKRSKMPGTSDWLQVAEGLDGRYITGIDEDSYEINLITDPLEKENKRNEIKQLREYLESRTGKDLKANSSFWEEFGVRIQADEDLILNKSNPMHQIVYHLLLANKYAAPSEEAAGDPRFLACKYYTHVASSITKQSVSLRKLRDKATKKLIEISEKGKEYMVLIGQYLDGKKFHSKLSEDDLYEMFSSLYIDSKDESDINRFIKATDKSIEEIQFKIVIDKAVRSKIIKYVNGYYQRGQVTIGKTLDNVYNNLQSPEFATEFLSIKEEIETN
jgi:hypothetical protein